MAFHTFLIFRELRPCGEIASMDFFNHRDFVSVLFRSQTHLMLVFELLMKLLAAPCSAKVVNDIGKRKAK